MPSQIDLIDLTNGNKDNSLSSTSSSSSSLRPVDDSVLYLGTKTHTSSSALLPLSTSQNTTAQQQLMFYGACCCKLVWMTPEIGTQVSQSLQQQIQDQQQALPFFYAVTLVPDKQVGAGNVPSCDE
jgi:hypothetical protein